MKRKRRSSVRELRPIAEQYGFAFAGLTKRGHLRWRGRDGRIVITASALEAPRTLANIRALMRRRGSHETPLR